MSIPEQFAGRGDTYVLQVRGDSMIDAGILAGDFIVVERQQTARYGRDRRGRNPRRRSDRQALLRPGLAHHSQTREFDHGAHGVRFSRSQHLWTGDLGPSALLERPSTQPLAQDAFEVVELAPSDHSRHFGEPARDPPRQNSSRGSRVRGTSQRRSSQVFLVRVRRSAPRASPKARWLATAAHSAPNRPR